MGPVLGVFGSATTVFSPGAPVVTAPRRNISVVCGISAEYLGWESSLSTKTDQEQTVSRSLLAPQEAHGAWWAWAGPAARRGRPVRPDSFVAGRIPMRWRSGCGRPRTTMSCSTRRTMKLRCSGRSWLLWRRGSQRMRRRGGDRSKRSRSTPPWWAGPRGASPRRLCGLGTSRSYRSPLQHARCPG